MNPSYYHDVEYVTNDVPISPFFDEIFKKSGVEIYDSEIVPFLITYMERLISIIT